MPEKVTELDQRLSTYLKAVKAQMPTVIREGEVSDDSASLNDEKRRESGGKGGGGKGGKNGRKQRENSES